MAFHDIHTTVNLSREHATILNESAVKLRVSRSKLVVLLLRKLLVNLKKRKCNFTSVQYQKNAGHNGWKKVHVFFEPVDYEVFTDMRNYYKWSVSALLAMAIDRYLDEILEGGKENFEKNFDKYLIHDYNCDGKLDRTDFCWHITWKLSQELAKKLRD